MYTNIAVPLGERVDLVAVQQVLTLPPAEQQPQGPRLAVPEGIAHDAPERREARARADEERRSRLGHRPREEALRPHGRELRSDGTRVQKGRAGPRVDPRDGDGEAGGAVG